MTAHHPVMLSEVIELLRPRDGGFYVDGSFGGGGHARAILEAADCAMLAIDRDPDAIKRGAALAQDFPDRLTLMQGRFGDLADLLARASIERVDGITFDAGVSSFQLDEPARGFSFQHDGALDMRMDYQNGKPASDVVNQLSEHELAHIIGVYGEEKIAKKIARAIIKARDKNQIRSTKQLVEVILSVRPRRAHDRIHPATRTFQALRIFINDELTELSQGLVAAEQILSEGGRLVVISFHSLEDRIVKNFFKARCGQTGAGVNRHQPAAKFPPASFEALTKSPRRSSEAEIRSNARARSARLRAAQRTAHPPYRETHEPVAAI